MDIIDLLKWKWNKFQLVTCVVISQRAGDHTDVVSAPGLVQH